MISKGKLYKENDNWMVCLTENEISHCKLHPKNSELVETLINEHKIKEGQEVNFHVGIDCLKDCMGLCGECDSMEKYPRITELDYK